MEGQDASNKRKINHGHEEDHHEKEKEDDDDEEKMEKFFALVKRIRETRETLKCSGDYNENMIKNKKQKIMGELDQKKKQMEVWTPSFRHEDFMQNDGKLNNNPPHVTTLVCTSQTEEDASIKDVKEDLDLKLSL